jgi:hypothetical protein
VSIPAKAFLNPVEKPKGIALRLAHFFNEKQFGKVIGRLRALKPRIPIACEIFFPKLESSIKS